MIKGQSHERILSCKVACCIRKERDEHELINDKSEILIKCSDWKWAELDDKSIAWASTGCVSLEADNFYFGI